MDWGVAYYQVPDGSVPAADFLDACPRKVDANFAAGRLHYRLFCRLENGTPAELESLGYDRPQIIVINGMVKKNAELFTDAEYKKNVRDLGDDYLSRAPRPIAA